MLAPDPLPPCAPQPLPAHSREVLGGLRPLARPYCAISASAIEGRRAAPATTRATPRPPPTSNSPCRGQQFLPIAAGAASRSMPSRKSRPLGPSSEPPCFRTLLSLADSPKADCSPRNRSTPSRPPGTSLRYATPPSDPRSEHPDRCTPRVCDAVTLDASTYAGA